MSNFVYFSSCFYFAVYRPTLIGFWKTCYITAACWFFDFNLVIIGNFNTRVKTGADPGFWT
jgi:hypothetical protein